MTDSSKTKAPIEPPQEQEPWSTWTFRPLSINWENNDKDRAQVRAAAEEEALVRAGAACENNPCGARGSP